MWRLRSLWPALLLLTVLFGGLALTAPPLRAAGTTYYVSIRADDDGTSTANCANPQNTDCTLRDALAAATSGFDTIQFNASLGGFLGLDNGLTVAHSVTIAGSGADAMEVNGYYNLNIFTVNAGVTATISGLTIRQTIGAIVNNGTLTLLNSTITDSFANPQGAGILNSGTLTVRNSTISNNHASFGAGIMNREGGTVTVANSTFSGNAAETGGGGGLFNQGTATVTNSTFTGNSGAAGAAAIYNSGGRGTRVNIATGVETEIIYPTGTLTVTSSTISGNTGGGIGNDGTLRMANTIVAANDGGDLDNHGTLTSNHNLIGGTPQLSALDGNGGPTQTMALLAGSPAINAGDSAVCAAAPVSGRDQRGISRPANSCDIGAFQSQGLTAPSAAAVSAWIIGTTAQSGGYSILQYTNGSWTTVSGAATGVAVGPDGQPWVVNAVGSIYRRVNGNWQQVAGTARQISIGADGSVWAIGTGAQSGGYGIYQYTSGNWTAVSGAAVRIAVGPDGQPWVINDGGRIFRRVNGAWQAVPGSAREISVGADGSVWIIGTDAQSGGYGIYQYTGSGWTQVAGAAVRIAVGADGQPWVLNAVGSIYRRVNGAWQAVPGSAKEIGVY